MGTGNERGRVTRVSEIIATAALFLPGVACTPHLPAEPPSAEPGVTAADPASESTV